MNSANQPGLARILAQLQELGLKIERSQKLTPVLPRDTTKQWGQEVVTLSGEIAKHLGIVLPNER